MACRGSGFYLTLPALAVASGTWTLAVRPVAADDGRRAYFFQIDGSVPRGAELRIPAAKQKANVADTLLRVVLGGR
jgi:hypothetical protein